MPSEIIDFWPLIEPGVKEISTRAQDWLPEHLQERLSQGTATLILISINNESAGFLVYRWLQQPLTGIRYIHIWLYYIFRKYRGNIRAISWPTLDYLKTIINRNDAAYLEITSTRKGWGRVLRNRIKFAYAVYRMGT